MKLKYFLFFLSILFCTLSASSQQTNKCATVTKNEIYLAKHSSERQSSENIERKINDWISENRNAQLSTTLLVPVVVHVIYKTPQQNIPESQIKKQIEILNADYSRKNADSTQTPTPFKSLAADIGIQFCLAGTDPLGNLTNGITRTLTTVDEIGNNEYYNSSNGGENIWNHNHYLNIWVCEIDATLNTLGFATLASTAANAKTNDGVVIDYRVFGTSTNTHYNLGRTATHEVGHWFDLKHPWGDDSNLDGNCDLGECSGDDGIVDTPQQCDCHYGVPIFPSLDFCTNNFPGTMFMDYMDYTDDEAMNMFTLEQKTHMWSAIMNTVRDSLFNSHGCEQIITENKAIVYPNPSNGTFSLQINLVETQNVTVKVYNDVGQSIREYKMENVMSNSYKLYLTDLARGFYFLDVSCAPKKIVKKIFIY